MLECTLPGCSEKNNEKHEYSVLPMPWTSEFVSSLGFPMSWDILRLNSSLEPLILLLWSALPPQPLPFSVCLGRVGLLKSLVLFHRIPTWGSNVSKESVSRIIIDILRVTIIFYFAFTYFRSFVCQISLNKSLPGKFYFLYSLFIYHLCSYFLIQAHMQNELSLLNLLSILCI